MLIKLLSEEDQSDFHAIAQLISICDKPISIKQGDATRLGGGVIEVGMQKLTILEGQREVALLEQLNLEGSSDGTYQKARKGFFAIPYKDYVNEKFIENIKRYSIERIEENAVKLEVSLIVLDEILTEKKISFPSVPKLMLFEWMQVALVNGQISAVAGEILNRLKLHYKLEDYVFEDLLERAEVTSREINKTITIIFE